MLGFTRFKANPGLELHLRCNSRSTCWQWCVPFFGCKKQTGHDKLPCHSLPEPRGCAFLHVLNIIQLFCLKTFTTCLIKVDVVRRSSFSAKECILGYSFEQDLHPAQAASAFRHCSSRNFPS